MPITFKDVTAAQFLQFWSLLSVPCQLEHIPPLGPGAGVPPTVAYLRCIAAQIYFKMQKWLRAKLESPCAVCGETITAGDRILPFVAAGQHRFRYMHLSCAKRTNQAQEQEASETPVCKHWKSRGFCLYGDNCVFQHPPELAAAQQPARRAAKAAGEHAAARVGATKQRVKIKKRFRAGAFRRFLIDTFGREQLRSGAGVLDVAGGKGELAFELANLNGIPATVVEPRVLDLAKRAKWLKFGFYNWNSLFSAYNDRVWISRSVEQSAAAAAAAAPAGDSGSEQGGPASAAAALGAAGSMVLPNHLRMVITTEVSQLLGLHPSSSPDWVTPGAAKGSAGTDTLAGASTDAGASVSVSSDAEMAAAAPAAPAVSTAPLQHGTAAEGAGSSSSSEGPAPAAAAGAAGSEMKGQGSSSALLMPPEWPAAFWRAQVEAQHSRWTHKGFDHESAAAAAAALGGDGGWSSEDEVGDEDGDTREGAREDGEERGGAASSQPPPSPAAAAEPASTAGAAGSGGSSLPPEQLAQVGSFLDGLFSSMEAAGAMPATGQPPLPEQPQHGHQGEALAASPACNSAGTVEALAAESGRAAGAAVGGSAGATPAAAGPAAAAPNSAAQQQAAGGSWEAGEAQEGQGSGISSLPQEQLAQVGSFLDGLFSSMESAGMMPTAGQPLLTEQPSEQGQHGEQGGTVVAAPISSGAGMMQPPAAEGGSAAGPAVRGSTYASAAAAPPSAAAAGGSNSPATTVHEEWASGSGLGVAGFLEDLFVRIEAGGAEAAAPVAPVQQAPAREPPVPAQQPAQQPALLQQPTPAQQPLQQHAAAAGAAGPGPTTADMPASGTAGSQSAAAAPSFMEGLLARMDEQAWVVTPEQQAAAAELAAEGHAAVEVGAATPRSPSPPAVEPAPAAAVASAAIVQPEQRAAPAPATASADRAGTHVQPLPGHAAAGSASGAGAGADVGEFLAALFERMEAAGPEPQPGIASEQGPGAAGQEAAEAEGPPPAAVAAASAAAAAAASEEGEPLAGQALRGSGGQAQEQQEQAQQQVVGGREVEERGGSGEQTQEQQGLGGREVDDPQEAWHLLTRASVIVGMHPDQTTEFIVDLALRHGRPFAVVPCCVYPSQFPGRRLRGRPVRTYEQLVEYLVAKAPDRIQVAQLPFQGMNKVLYCL